MHKDDCLLYESGEMTADEAGRFEQHLASCAECRDWLAVARSAHRLAAALIEKPPPRLAGAAPGADGPLPSRWFGVRPLGLAALVAAAYLGNALIKRAPPAGTQWDSADLHAAISRVKSDLDGIADEIGHPRGGPEERLKGLTRRLREEQEIVRWLLDESRS